MTTFTEVAQNHFSVCFQMFTNIIELCPQSQWDTGNENSSIWKRFLHTLESIDYWLSDNTNYLFPAYFFEMSAEMNHSNKQSLSKEQISAYIGLMTDKIERFFINMNDRLLISNSSRHPNLTFFDIIFSQIRHIQNNTGYCCYQLKCTSGISVAWSGCKET
jgi:hypothetical protein